jgi:hypothetical protein
MCIPFIGSSQDNPVIEKHLDQLVKRFDLTTEQTVQAKEIYTQFFIDLQAWRKNKSETRFEERQKMESERMNKVYAILNKDQQAKMAPMMEKRQTKMAERATKRKEKEAQRNQLKQNPKQR